MGQKQSYRLDEGGARNTSKDGEVAYNTDTPAPGQPTSVLIRPVDVDNMPSTPLGTPPPVENTTEREPPMPATPIEIAPPPTPEESEVLVSVIPATPATDTAVEESAVDVEPASEQKIEGKQELHHQSPEANVEPNQPVVVTSSSCIETTTVLLNGQPGEEGKVEVVKNITVLLDSSTSANEQQEVSNVQHQEEEYAVDCGQFDKRTTLAGEQTPSSPQPMTPPSSLTGDNLDLLERIEPLPQIPLQSTTDVQA